jgi:hypothetical protein
LAASLFTWVPSATSENKEAAKSAAAFLDVASWEARGPKRPVTLVAVGPPPDFFDFAAAPYYRHPLPTPRRESRCEAAVEPLHPCQKPLTSSCPLASMLHAMKMILIIINGNTF